MSRARDGDLKENYRESGGHISFHNPNYSCNSGASGGSAEQLERRPNRFQGIFKYDKNQVITSTIYLQYVLVRKSNLGETLVSCFTSKTMFLRVLFCKSVTQKLLQERVTNVYIPEGTSLLPPPPPPPRPAARPATHDDFEPVTLHSYA